MVVSARIQRRVVSQSLVGILMALLAARGALLATLGASPPRLAPSCAPPRGARLTSRLARFSGGSGGRATHGRLFETQLLRQQLVEVTREIKLLREFVTQAEVPSSVCDLSASGDGAAGARPQATPTQREPHGQATAAPQAMVKPATKVGSDIPLGNTGSIARGASQPPKVGKVKTRVVVVSAGMDAGDLADFFLEDRRVAIAGASGRRGVNLVSFDPAGDLGAPQVGLARSYDVWGNPEVENRALVTDLHSLPPGHIVLVALKDSGLEELSSDALVALKGVGCTLERPAFRDSYALIGVKGGAALAEQHGHKLMLVEAILPFGVELPLPLASLAPAPAASRASGEDRPPSPSESDSLALQKARLQYDMDLARERASVPKRQKTWEDIILMMDEYERV